MRKKKGERLFRIASYFNSHDAKGKEIGYFIHALNKEDALEKALRNHGFFVIDPEECCPQRKADLLS